jgi:hypothetical protein
MGSAGIKRKKRHRPDGFRADPSGWRGSPAWPAFRNHGWTREGELERLRWGWHRRPFPRLTTWVGRLAFGLLAGFILFGILRGLF